MTDDAIPLPPQHIIDQMVANEPITTAPGKAPPVVAALAFTGDKPWSVEIELDFPFDWQGRTIRTVTVHRLITQAIAAIGDRKGASVELMDIYAAMTDLPVEVLRGLEAGDGTRVTEAAYDFLPRAYRMESA